MQRQGGGQVLSWGVLSDPPQHVEAQAMFPQECAGSVVFREHSGGVEGVEPGAMNREDFPDKWDQPSMKPQMQVGSIGWGLPIGGTWRPPCPTQARHRGTHDSCVGRPGS